MNFPKPIADFYKYDLSISGLADNVSTDVTGSELYLPAGKYCVLFGGYGHMTYSVAPTRGSQELLLVNASDVSFGGTVSSSINEHSTTQWRSFAGGLTVLETTGEVVHLRGKINDTGGTISDRSVFRAHIFAYKLN